MMTNPYYNFVSAFAQLVESGKSLPLGNFPPRPKPQFPAPKAFGATTVLIFSPHPDDECLVGGFALRLMREAKMRVVNIPVTLGSNAARRPSRREELKNACEWLGFELVQAAPDGLKNINPQARAEDAKHWTSGVESICGILARYQPRAIFFPHEHDWNRTHIGTHYLVTDALKRLPASVQCLTIETEYWAPLSSPNLMVESSAEDVADLLAALSCHVGEMKRNPYHLRMPAWMLDNVRRGAELAGGQGGAAPDFGFATLYRLRRWNRGRFENVFDGGRQLGVAENPSALIA